MDLQRWKMILGLARGCQMIPDYGRKLCDPCRSKIGATQDWGKAAKGLNNPREYAREIMAGLCSDCRGMITRLAIEEGHRRKHGAA